VENKVVSLDAVGLTVDDEARSEALAISGAAGSLIKQCFPSVLLLLQRADEAACVCLTPFVHAYLGQLKLVQKRAPLFRVTASLIVICHSLDGLAMCCNGLAMCCNGVAMCCNGVAMSCNGFAMCCNFQRRGVMPM
jgi:hypothetical protein